jgi:hypothetical protein
VRGENRKSMVKIFLVDGLYKGWVGEGFGFLLWRMRTWRGVSKTNGDKNLDKHTEYIYVKE